MTTKAVRPRYLMCSPRFYGVNYVINPWMEGNLRRSNPGRAEVQWDGLYRAMSEVVDVHLVEARAGWPDMVFTANAGLIIENTVVLSRFLHPERQGEEPFFEAWFRSVGLTLHQLPPGVAFEGAGDALFDRGGDWLWAGYGFRTARQAHPLVSALLDVEVLSLGLSDPRFYHLDTCLCPLEDGYLLYYPPAFDRPSNRLIESRVSPNKRIVVGEEDALRFACNAVNTGNLIVTNLVSDELAACLAERGFRLLQTPLDEFLLAGGAAKCLTLRLDEKPQPAQKTAAPSCLVELRGHLLDSPLMSEAMDLLLRKGARCEVRHFAPGPSRQDLSSARLLVTAPTGDGLAGVLEDLRAQGALLPVENTVDASLQIVEQPGVAPFDFYTTDIYPTEVCVQGQWVRVGGQRMDGAIVVDPAALRARCVLLRDLQPGERVVCTGGGVRTLRSVGEQERSSEFAFMTSGVSSERRVELVVEQVAWQLRRIRRRGGRVVVVAGPVVIHTGGGVHLASLIREGYVQALLGGNAIAVHDIEQSFHGTSLGVDLARGVVIEGGHRHHLKTINLIRACGGIAPAVEQGVLRTGVFYECVKAGVPFSLAGSIRDDGPLPDTEMDLLKAQADYARLIEGAEMILMLSSMLHSIGVGNMTPAGVQMVCVDINPAVVTKLADRGSVESLGVVTDVGLFLNLLGTRVQTATPIRQPIGEDYNGVDTGDP